MEAAPNPALRSYLEARTACAFPLRTHGLGHTLTSIVLLDLPAPDIVCLHILTRQLSLSRDACAIGHPVACMRPALQSSGLSSPMAGSSGLPAPAHYAIPGALMVCKPPSGYMRKPSLSFLQLPSPAK